MKDCSNGAILFLLSINQTYRSNYQVHSFNLLQRNQQKTTQPFKRKENQAIFNQKETKTHQTEDKQIKTNNFSYLCNIKLRKITHITH